MERAACSKKIGDNHGEIGCRIIKTAHRMRIACVATDSEADRNALFVVMADASVLIGRAPAAQSYLAVDYPVMFKASAGGGTSAA